LGCAQSLAANTPVKIAPLGRGEGGICHARGFRGGGGGCQRGNKKGGVAPAFFRFTKSET
jgi:hypothetical protein